MAKPYFRDPAFWRAEIDAFFKNNPQFYTPSNKALLEKEFLNLIDTYKPFLENIVNICITTVDAANVIKFVWFARRAGFTNHNIATIFNHITGLKDDARFFINTVGTKLLGMEEAAKKIGQASIVFLVITVSVQVLIHIRRNEYGLALGEIIKTLLSVACFPAAVFDMFDQILSTFAPSFMQHPFVRAFRMLNGLQGAKHLADTLLTLGMIFGYAYQHRYTEVENAYAALADHWEKSPFGFATEVSRGAIEVLERYLPDWAKFDWIVNLAEYHRTHPVHWAF